MPHKVYISLGTNIGDREKFLCKALEAFPPKIQITKRSLIYETEPWGFKNQGDFLNQVIEAETSLDPHELMQVLKKIEKELGREKIFKYGPRNIDLDILFFDDAIIHDEDLNIPHPMVPNRAFVLIPLKEIAPDFVHPESGISVSELAESISNEGVELYK